MEATRSVLLVGSVPLDSAEQVFRTAATILSTRLRRTPDGETGERLGWIGWQFKIFASDPRFEVIPAVPGGYTPIPHVRLRTRDADETLAFGLLGYAVAARASWADFARLQRDGVIPSTIRFQVSLPTPLAPITSFVVPEDQSLVEPPYEARLLAEVAEICGAIPHSSLAIQWDVAIEMAIWEGFWPAHFADFKRGMIERLTRLGEQVPVDVELGYHLCYGDYGHRHFKQPADSANLVEGRQRDHGRDQPADQLDPYPGAQKSRRRGLFCAAPCLPSSAQWRTLPGAFASYRWRGRRASADRGGVARHSRFRYRDRMRVRTPPACYNPRPAAPPRGSRGRLDRLAVMPTLHRTLASRP
jgi:hypothetical protein